MKIEEFLRRVCAALETADIPYMVTGSVASSIHGVPRSTNDLDIVIAPSREQLFSLIQTFKRFGYYANWQEAEQALRKRDQFNVIDFPNAWKVDLIVRKDREYSETEFERRGPIDTGELRFEIASAEDVLIAKLEWFRLGESQRQLEDAAGIIRVQGDLLDKAYIAKWVDRLKLQSEWNAACRLVAG